MKPLPALLSCATAGLLLSAAPLRATPEPSPTPVSWELLLEPTAPRTIQVDTGEGPVTYWYMLYSVTNLTGEDVAFHPEIVRVNEIESELPAGEVDQNPELAPKLTTNPAIVGVPQAVFDAIRRLHEKTHPFLVRPVDAITSLRQGRDNALTSVAVFPDLDVRASRFTIYFAGLSGEKLVKPNPAYRPPAGDQAADPEDNAQPVFVLRKTLAIPYTLPGDASTRRLATPKLGRMEWVMR